MALQKFLVVPGEPVRAPYVDADQLRVRARRHARAPPDQAFTLWRAGQRHHDALTRLPRLGDPVSLAILPERFVDAIRHPQQGELAQRAEVADPEVVTERGVDSLGRVDVAMGHAASQGLRRHVNELDLFRGAARPRQARSRAARSP